MRILICIATMESGGAERQVAYLAKALVDAGQEVHVALIAGGSNYERLVASGATIHMVGIFPKHSRFVVPILRILRKVRPDITYLWQRPFDILGGIACLASRATCVHAERTDPAKLRSSGLKVQLRRWIVPFSAGVISNSDAGRNYWERSPRLLHRVTTIPNIIPVEELAAVVPSEETSGSAVVVGRLDSGKNVITLIKAIATLRDKGVTVPLSIVGDGPLYGAVQELIAECELSEQVKLKGHRSDVWALIKGSRLFISLSRYEGEPNAVLEAVAMRRRLLLSDIPAHRSIAAAANATYVDPDSIAAIATALQAIFQDGEEERSIDEGLNEFLRTRSAAAIGSRHLRFFDSVVRRRAD